jgi:hypothetical protein
MAPSPGTYDSIDLLPAPVAQDSRPVSAVTLLSALLSCPSWGTGPVAGPMGWGLHAPPLQSRKALQAAQPQAEHTFPGWPPHNREW